MCLVCGWYVFGVWLVCVWCVVGVCLVCGWYVVGMCLVCGWCVVGMWSVNKINLFTNNDIADYKNLHHVTTQSS